MKLHFPLAMVAVFCFLSMAASHATGLCEGAGPQTPRDISNSYGENMASFPLAPPYFEMNLCNIHTHTNAEHKGPGFNLFVGDDAYGGYACNDREQLTPEQLQDPFAGKGNYQGVKPGDTIEVHWVYSSCDIAPGEGLAACQVDGCVNPKLRVETQVFLLVNDNSALNFNDYIYTDTVRNGFHQSLSLPKGTGVPVIFRGSTTGSKYSNEICSPVQVTWSVRPLCARLNIASLHIWAQSPSNVFKENHSHQVRQLVTNPALLAPIE